MFPSSLNRQSQLCEKQKACRDAARKLVEEMDDLLTYGVDRLEDMLKSNPTTKKAFQVVAEVFEEISTVIEKENKGIMTSFIRKYQLLYTTYSA